MRNFVHPTPLGLTLLMVSSLSRAALPNGVAAGDVNQNSAVLWGRTDTAGSLTVEYAADSNFSTILGSLNTTVADPLTPLKWDVSGLSANTQYFYRYSDSTGSSQTGQFKTAANLGDYQGLRFGVSGDQQGQISPYPAVTNAAGLDFFVHLGDSIYADSPSNANGGQVQAQTLTEFQNKQVEVYSSNGGLNALADLRASTAWYAVIDDHEVTNDFAGGANISTDPRFAAGPPGLINDSTLFNNGLQAFENYNPIQHLTYADTGSDPLMDGETMLYRSRTFGNDAAMMMVDSRSFRSQELPGVLPTSTPAEISAFLAASFDPSRTLLGNRQLAQLESDLLTAQANDVTWKFVMLPEPIQNLGVLGASDRFEGYAAERSALLGFIDANDIENVVFVSADIHGTLVNNLTYQTSPSGPQIATSAFEVTTGPVAHNPPFAITLVRAALLMGVPGALSEADFNALSPALQEVYIQTLVNAQLSALGYDALGLQGSGIDASLLQGGYTATDSYGWTDFAIDPHSQVLTITTYGISPYTQQDVNNNLAGILSRTPQIVSQFQVNPTGYSAIPEPSSAWLIAAGLAVWRRRKVTIRG